jgi:hypothetical protein
MSQHKLGSLASSLATESRRTREQRKSKKVNKLVYGGLATAAALAVLGGGTYLLLNRTQTKSRRTKGSFEGNTNALKNVI